MKVINVVIFVIFMSALSSCGDESNYTEPEPSPASTAAPLPDPAVSTNKEVSDENNNPATAVPNVVAATLNPAHGQPGHRCDIAVGQPLNSKPAAKASTAFNPPTPTTTATAPSAPAIKPFSAPVFGATPLLNPAHGQPGHRCDIQVGQPLNSKPAPTNVNAPSPVTSPAASPFPSITPTPNTSTVATGLNPAHGQPGHRCDIQVGQPLNSKPPQTSLPSVK